MSIVLRRSISGASRSNRLAASGGCRESGVDLYLRRGTQADRTEQGVRERTAMIDTVRRGLPASDDRLELAASPWVVTGA